jgi:hypothetical protein
LEKCLFSALLEKRAMFSKLNASLVKQVDPNLWLVVALSVFAWGPLLTPAYFFNAHDAKHSVFFLVEFDQTFRDGYLWPRWSPDFSFGYGYPLFNLYAPLSFYGAQVLVLTGFGFTAAIKIMYILATIGAGLSMYGFVRRLYGTDAGLLAAVVYMYVPFHLVEIFVRSAYAEFVALAVIPLLFWAFTELVSSPSPRRVALAALAYGALALTHHTTFFTYTPLLMIYIIFLLLVWAGFGPKPFVSRALSAGAAGALGVGLAGIYLIPLVAELRFVKVEQWTSGSYDYLQHFVYFSQLLSPEWGFGYAGAGLLDDFSFQIGIVALSLFSFVVVLSLSHRYPHRNIAFFFIVLTMAAILMMSTAAESIWQVLPIAALVQFPWRLLTVSAFCIAVVSGPLVASVRSIELIPAALSLRNPDPAAAKIYLLSLVVILASFAFTRPQYTEIPAWAETPLAVINWDRASIADRVGMVAVTEEQPHTSPMEQQYLAGEPLTTAGIIAGRGTVEIVHHGGGSDEISVSAAEPVTVQFYTYDYPGWQVTLNGRPIAYRPEPPFGLITVDVPAGEHTLRLQMGRTLPRTVGGLTSGLSLAILIGLFFSPSLRTFKVDNSK